MEALLESTVVVFIEEPRELDESTVVEVLPVESSWNLHGSTSNVHPGEYLRPAAGAFPGGSSMAVRVECEYELSSTFINERSQTFMGVHERS